MGIRIYISADINDQSFGFTYDTDMHGRNDYDAVVAMDQLDKGVAKIKAAIRSTQAPDTRAAESRTVHSGPVSLKTVPGVERNVYQGDDPVI